MAASGNLAHNHHQGPNGVTGSPWADDPIAIVGIGLRLPGAIRTTEQYWDFLTNKKSGRGRVPASRYNVDAFVGPPGKAGHTCTEYGYFLDDIDLAAIDSSFWSMSRKEAGLMDPQQRLMLEVVHECLENAGVTGYKGQQIGCYIGTFGEDWMDIQAKDAHNSGIYRITGYGDFAISNRVSYEFGFTGPSMTIRTACSSSLTALYEACQAVHAGECSSAIVGGCNMILSPHMTVAMTEQGVISPTGQCRCFDADADGYARGEAVNAVYIKRLSNALRDGDPVRAVIRSACINSDGRTAGLSFPSPESHEKLIRRSHHLANITDLSATAMIECHGTGTAVGDPLEATAVANVFGEWGMLIGSVKSNLGHSEGASGLSSVVKMVLALENQSIPPNINFKTPNPKIPFEAAGLRVPVDCETWPVGKAERVGVNSFGIGGANAHVLLESATSMGLGSQANGLEKENDTPSRLLVFSATHSETVSSNIENTMEYMSDDPAKIANVSYTLACRRERFPHRAFAIWSKDESLEIANVLRVGQPPSPVVVFTGQGAQYAEMGKDLLMTNSVARDTLEHLDEALDAVETQRGWTLLEELMRPPEESKLSAACFSQPCCTAIQIALVDILWSLGFTPATVVGHSSGEIAAAYAAHALTAKDAIAVAYRRGQVSSRAEGNGKGGMMAVSLGRDQVVPYLSDGVTIACENSPLNVTLSGDPDVLDTIAQDIQANHPSAMTRRLRVKCAYHTAQMTQVEDDYLVRLKSSMSHSQQANLKALFVSSVTGKEAKHPHEFGPDYWCRNLTSPVLFNTAVSRVLASGIPNPLFIEVGPHSALSGPLREIATDCIGKQVPYIPTLVRNANSYKAILRMAGHLFQSNTSLDLSSLCRGRILQDMPVYAWHYDGCHWSESRVTRNWRFRKHSHHDILGSMTTDGNDREPTWRSIIHLENVPWIRDHIIVEETVFPGAGYVAMAGEAIRQLTGFIDFSVRNVNIIALVMHEDRPTEVLTQFRPSRVTATIDSEWYDFTIMSHLDGVWTKNCTGQARGGQQFPVAAAHPTAGHRKVEPPVWYRAMKRFGFNYGPRFQGLENITASIPSRAATAEVCDSRDSQESCYTIHPCTIDYIFQLFSVAGFQGIARLFDHLAVPTFIEEMYIRPPSGRMTVQSVVDATPKGAFSGDATGFCGQELVLRLQNLRLSLLSDGAKVRGIDPHAGARLMWKPDIDDVDLRPLVRQISDISDDHFLIEELALCCMMESEYRTRGMTPSLPHYIKFHDWLRAQRRRAEQGTYDHVVSCNLIASLSSGERVHRIESLYAKTVETTAKHVATAIRRVFQESINLISGKTEPLDVLMKDDLLASIYNFGQLCNFQDFFRLFAHNRPKMRVLEVGAGTGGATANILLVLRGPHGERMYESYTYTDISAGFSNAAQERFKNYDAVVYRSLDIASDPLAQGFNAHSYDLIIASNALHVTASLQQSLRNVSILLKPDGKLFLQELAPITKWINYVMGVLPGWWLGEMDNRQLEPYVTSERWDEELRKAGLSRADAVMHDGHINTHIISSAVKDLPRRQMRVAVLCDKNFSPDGPSQHVHQFLATLGAHGFSCSTWCLGDELPPSEIVVSLLEHDRPVMHSIGSQEFRHLRELITTLGETPLLWITKPSQISCRDPRYALILGFLRTARTELSVTAASLEIDSLDENAQLASVKVVERVLNKTSSDSALDPISEYVYSSGKLMVGKFYPSIVGDEILETKPASTARALHIQKRGLLQTLSWKPREVSCLTGDAVEVETKATGLNFRDLLIAMGIVEGKELGAECAGIVRRAGPEAKYLRPGDSVIVFAGGSLATRLFTNERLCVKMAQNLNWVEGATIPCAFATVLYSLIDIARLKGGDTVLIHSACGGIGLAAIQICRIVGAEIYCTVGTETKGEYLVNKLSVPRERIFNSRDITFLRDVLEATDGAGVDVVLNSLSELGKRDFIGKGTLAMDMFESNRTFAGVDFAQICAQRPEITQRLLRQCMHHFELGELSPLPIHEFTAIKVEQAFRYIQKGTHIGKVAIVMPDSVEAMPLSLNPRQPQLRPDGCHVIVGGLGGIGRSLSSWMCHHGARDFIFFSRSAGEKSEDDFILELRAHNCRVDLVSGDVSSKKDVDLLFEKLDRPVAGIMQGSMVLKDASLANMTFEEWQAAVIPKVEGTWNLHESLEKHGWRVDYFVLFSSWSGLVGQWGQANYAAGNTFLDAFVQYRHSLGLPCSAVNIGVMEDVGYVSRNSHILDHFRSTSTHTLQEQNLLDTIQLAVDNSLPSTMEGDSESSYTSRGQICIGLRSTMALNSPSNRTIWKRDPRMEIYYNFASTDMDNSSGESNDNERLKQFVQQARLTPDILETPASADFLAEEIGRALFNFMLRDYSELDLDVSLASMGVDSLLAIELRNWFRLNIGIDITVLEITSSGSLRKLGEMTAKNSAMKLAAGSQNGISTAEAKAAEVEDMNSRYLNMKAP